MYSLPAVAVEVLRLTRNPQVDARALKECIENDPALTTKILRVVNSSLFGLSGEVSDLNQALALLGTKPLKLLVLGFSLPDALFADVNGETLAHYWRHTVTKAVAARLISETLWDTNGDEAFIAGLLEDLGVLILIGALGAPYTDVLQKTNQRGGDLATAEQGALGFEHTRLTSRLLKTWGLPQLLVDVVGAGAGRLPIESLDESRQTLAKILCLAELLTRWVTTEQSDALVDFVRLGKQYRQVTMEQIQELVADLQQRTPQLAEVLSLQLSEGQDYRDVLAAAHTQLAEVAEEAAPDIIRADRARNASAVQDDLLEEAKALSGALAKFVSSPPPDTAQNQSPGQSKAEENQHTSATSSQSRAADYADGQIDLGRMEGDPQLEGRLTAAVTQCRQARASLSLVLVDLDNFANITFGCGEQTAAELVDTLRETCGAVEHPLTECMMYREAQFALVLPDCDRDQAVQLTDHLVKTVQRLGEQRASGGIKMTVSAGVATVSMPPKNFPAQDLIDRAERCLYAAQTSGGNCLKSIEIY